MQKQLGFFDADSEGAIEYENLLSSTDWLGRKVHFRCSEHKEAFDRLPEKQQQYIASYMRFDSLDEVINDLGLLCSRKTLSKNLAKIVKRMGTKLRDLRVKAIKQSVTAKELKQLIEQQEFRCALSGELLTPDNTSLDHREAVSDGGGHEVENLQWLLTEVNRMKGSLSQSRFVELCRKVHQWNS